MNKKQRAKELVLSVYRDSKDFYSSIRQEWNQLYNLSIGKSDKKKKKFNRFVPIIPAYIDLVLPRIAGRLPIFNVEGRSPDDHEHAELMEKVVEYFLDKTNFHEFELNFIHQAVVYGTSVAQIGWDLQKKQNHPDVASQTGETESVYKDQPLHEIIPIENLFPHRKKVKIDDEWGLVIREEVSRRDLKNDPNIDNASLGQVGAPQNEDDWFSQLNRNTNRNIDGHKNPTADPDDDVLVKLTYWGPFDGEESVITVVNGSVVCRLERNPFWHQCKPFVKLDYKPSSTNFFCEGLVKQLKDSQLELNEIRNVRSEARAIALKTPLLVDRGSNVNIDQMKWENSAVWLYDPTQNPNPIMPMKVEPKLLELDREEETAIRDMQLRSGINDVITGGDQVSVQGGDTATGASIAAEQTSLRFKTQSILIDNAMQEIGRQDISNIQQYVDQQMVFAITGDEDLEWRQYDPNTMRQFSFDFKVSPQSTLVEPKTAKREKLLQVKQLFENDPSIDQDKLDTMILDAFDIDSDQIKKSKEQMAKEQASQELEQVATQINSPDFAMMNPQERQLMVDHMNTLRGQVEQGQQQPPEGAIA